MLNFFKQFKWHALWGTVFIIAACIITAIKNRNEIDLSFYPLIKDAFRTWLGIFGTYFVLQIICYSIYRKLFYLTFFITYFWTPKNYQHEPKDAVFSGLWMFIIIALGIYFKPH